MIEISQNNQTVSEFYTKIKTVWDSIDDVNPVPTCEKCTCELGHKIIKKQKEQRLLQFLLKLNDKYSSVKGHIMMMHPLPFVSQVYRLIAQEEDHKNISQISHVKNVAFVAHKRNYGTSNAYAQKNFVPNNAQNFQRQTGPNYNLRPQNSAFAL